MIPQIWPGRYFLSRMALADAGGPSSGEGAGDQSIPSGLDRTSFKRFRDMAFRVDLDLNRFSDKVFLVELNA